jgi:hypothetical protein
MPAPPSPCDRASSEGSGSSWALPGSSPITDPRRRRKARQKSGPFPPPALPGLRGTMTLSDARQHRRPSRRWGRKPRAERASPDDPHHPSSVPCPLPRRIETGARAGSFPVPRGLPRISGGSASATSLSRPAQASLALRPAGSLNRPRRPLSQGFDRAGYPAGPLASYQTKPTTLWVEPSSTGDARRLGALRNPGFRNGPLGVKSPE